LEMKRINRPLTNSLEPGARTLRVGKEKGRGKKVHPKNLTIKKKKKKTLTGTTT